MSLWLDETAVPLMARALCKAGLCTGCTVYRGCMDAQERLCTGRKPLRGNCSCTALVPTSVSACVICTSRIPAGRMYVQVFAPAKPALPTSLWVVYPTRGHLVPRLRSAGMHKCHGRRTRKSDRHAGMHKCHGRRTRKSDRSAGMHKCHGRRTRKSDQGRIKLLEI